MDTKTTSIVAYITLIGLIIALCAGDREGAKFHLNQALVIWLFSMICVILLFLTAIPILGLIFAFINFIWAIFIFVCWIMGFIAAINQEEKPVPLIGGITLIK